MRIWSISLVLLLAAPAGARNVDAQKRRRIDELYRGYRKELGSFPELTVEQVLERRRKGQALLMVDAREPREQQVSMITGAITARALLQHPGRYRGKVLVAYCTIGYRSAVLVKALRARGFEAYNLAGSLLSWVHAGQPLVDSQGRPTRRLHVYGETWDLAPKGYHTVW